MKEKKKKKKISQMTLEELQQKKETLEQKFYHERKTKAKVNSTIVKWNANGTQSKYYKEIINEIKRKQNV